MPKHLLTGFSGLLLCCLAACSGPAAVDGVSGAVPPGSAALAVLPAINQLDALRTASSVQQPLDVTLPLSQSGTSAIGSNLGFAPAGGQIAYAIFRVQPPVETVLSMAAGGDDGLYLLVADYGSGLWTGAVEFAAGFAIAPLTALSDPLSPEGYVYCAVVAPAGTPGQLTSLALNYDGPANIFYVAPPEDGGDDGNPGTSDEPWATLLHAAATVVPDSLVIVRAGSYAPAEMLVSGSEEQPIIFHGEPGAVIDAPGALYGIRLAGVSWCTLEGLTVTGSTGAGIGVGGSGSGKAQHVTLRNNTLIDCGFGAIAVAYTDHALVEGNTCQGTLDGDTLQVGFDSDFAVVRHNAVINNQYSGIAFYNGMAGDNSLDNELAYANTSHGNGISGLGYGIVGDGLQNSVISNNLVYDNPVGLALIALNGLAAMGNTITHNTIVQEADQGSSIALQPGCTGNAMYNNILFCANPAGGAIEITSESLTGFLSDNNIVSDGFVLDDAHKTLSEWQSATLRDVNSQVSLPALTFVDPLAQDFHLLPTASAAGLALPDYMPADDLDGITRPQGGSPDCGCYELVP